MRASFRATAPGRVKPRIDLPDGAHIDFSRLGGHGMSNALLVTGIGGTGVVTIGQLIGMAAHLEGKAVTVLDMAGLAQKNGAVMSFVRIAESADQLHAPRIGAAGADAVIGGDIVVTASRDALDKYRRGHTRSVCNVAAIPTADFTRNADWQLPADQLQRAIADGVDGEQCWFVDATRLATALMGDAIAANLFLLGYAWQKGLLPLSAAAIERAIELNGVAVAQNQQAFRWGRRGALEPQQIESIVAGAGAGGQASAPSPDAAAAGEPPLDALIGGAVAEHFAVQPDRTMAALFPPSAKVAALEGLIRV